MRVRSSSLESVSTVRLGDTKPHPLSQTHSCSVDDVQNAASNVTNQGRPLDSSASTGDGTTSIDSMSLSCEGDSPKDRGFTQSLPAAIERKISLGSKDTQAGDTKKRELDCFSDNFVTTPEDKQTVSIVVYCVCVSVCVCVRGRCTVRLILQWNQLVHVAQNKPSGGCKGKQAL